MREWDTAVLLARLVFFFLLGLYSLFLSATNVHLIVFLTASGMCGWTMLSCQSWIASHLFPPHRSSSSGPHTCGRVCTFQLFFSMGVCVFICCTLLTKDVECKRLRQPVELVFFLSFLLHTINASSDVFATGQPFCPTPMMAAFTLWEERTTKDSQ